MLINHFKLLNIFIHLINLLKYLKKEGYASLSNSVHFDTELFALLLACGILFDAWTNLYAVGLLMGCNWIKDKKPYN